MSAQPTGRERLASDTTKNAIEARVEVKDRSFALVAREDDARALDEYAGGLQAKVKSRLAPVRSERRNLGDRHITVTSSGPHGRERR